MDVKQKRSLIIDLHKRGLTPAEIFKRLQTHEFSRQFIGKVIKRFIELGSLEDRPHTGRPRTATKPSMVKRIRERIRQNPKQSMRKIGKALGISEFAVRRVVHENLGKRPYKLQKKIISHRQPHCQTAGEMPRFEEMVPYRQTLACAGHC